MTVSRYHLPKTKNKKRQFFNFIQSVVRTISTLSLIDLHGRFGVDVYYQKNNAFVKQKKKKK